MTARLNDPIRIGSMVVRNRLYRAPVLEGASGAKEPWRVYAKHFEADLIGIGRPFYAEPDLAARFLAWEAGEAAAPLACESCNRCVVPQMLGLPGVCYNPGVNKKRAGFRSRARVPVASAGPGCERGSRSRARVPVASANLNWAGCPDQPKD